MRAELGHASDFTIDDALLDWLLEGDVSIRYQVYRDLLAQERPDLQARIAADGWGKRFLAARNPDGHWGRRYYQPKWISTHYTVLDLKNLGVSPQEPSIRETLASVLGSHKGPDGGINVSTISRPSDVCVCGMFLNFGCYFGLPEESLRSVVDFVLSQQLPDGGFNCDLNSVGATHSSVHTTLSTLEGFLEYRANGYAYRLNDIERAEAQSQEFLLQHRLYKSDRTGEIINKRFLLLSYPCRWFYDILRALDYFQAAEIDYDPRMRDALEVLRKKRRSDRTWPVQGKHTGQVHFEMEQIGRPSRWNTLRALRVLKAYGDA